MPGAAYLTKYVNIRDKNGVRVGDWAKQAEKGYATCTVCVPQKKIKFEKGSLELTRHSEREVHIKNSSKGTSNNNKSIFNFIADKEEDKIKSQAQDLEIMLTTFMSRHSIPPELATCLTTLLKQYIPDSKIIQKMTLSSTKARYLTLRGLAEHAEKETSEKVRKCDACSIAIDESEVNGRSELEVMVKFASQEGGIENKHLGCIDLEEGDAETIKNSIFDFLEEKQIDFRTKMIDVGMDGCSTMQGHKSGVITRMVEDVEELQSTGSCKAHNLSNVMKHATEAFDPDVKDALVDVYIDLGGAKGYGLKKKKNFESLCSRLGFKPYTFKRFVDTRFRTHRACIEPVLKNFPYLVKYYKSVKKLTPRQTRLKKFFVDNHDLTKLKLLFVSDANSEFDKGIDFFEEKQSHVHNTGDMLEKILVGQYRKIFDQFEIDTLMEDKTLKRKSRNDLINLDIETAKKLDCKKMFIGQKVEKELKSLGLTPTSPALSSFFEKVKRYHVTACKYLQKYFKVPLSSSVITNMSALNPKNQKNVHTAGKIKSLARKHTKVVENIRSYDGQNKLFEEIDRYVTDDDVEEINNDVNFESFWIAVSGLLDGAWQRYEILGRFALALGTRYDATSDVERSFSVMNYIHQNSQRNRMGQEMLNANLHIRSAVEHNKETIKSCDKCQSDIIYREHCHCSLFTITHSLRERCKIAYRLEEQAAKEKQSLNNNNLVDDEEMKNKKEAFEKEEIERKEKVKEDLKKGKVIWSNDRVFAGKKRKKEDDKNSAHDEQTSASKSKASKKVSTESDSNSSKVMNKSSLKGIKIPKK